MLKDLLNYYQVNVITNAAISEITGSGLRYELNGESYGLLSDTIITSIGYDSQNELKEKYQNNPKVHLLGDANFVGNLKHVVWQAWDLAKEI